jgi:hypothetical protein
MHLIGSRVMLFSRLHRPHVIGIFFARLLICSFAHRLELGYEQDAKRVVIEFAAHNRSWLVGTLFSEEQFTGFQRRCTEAGPCRSTHLLRVRFDENQALSVHPPKPTFPDEAAGRFKNPNVSIFALLPCIIPVPF